MVYFDCDSFVTLFDVNVWSKRIHLFKKLIDGDSIIHPKI